MSYVSPWRKVWLARWAESANEVHTDMTVGESGEGAGSLQGSVTMETGSWGSEVEEVKFGEDRQHFQTHWLL